MKPEFEAVGKGWIRFVCLSKGEIDFKSLRNTNFTEELCFLGEEASARRAGLVDICLSAT